MKEQSIRVRDSVRSRRDALKLAAGVGFSALLSGCRSSSVPLLPYRGARLRSRPSSPSLVGSSGRTQFDVGGSTAVAYVPPSVDRRTPTALLLVLHGAFRDVDPFVDGHRAGADSNGVIVVAPYASFGTWDAITGMFAEDIDLLDATLEWVFKRWTIAPARIAISGFSDGGTYSLAVGRSNGDYFSRIAAYSPGFLLDITPVGRPPILITHGVQDMVIPVENTSGFIVPWLRQEGYPVDYREFNGPHVVPLSAVNSLLQILGTGT